jgi:hypothetical protein
LLAFFQTRSVCAAQAGLELTFFLTSQEKCLILIQEFNECLMKTINLGLVVAQDIELA